MMKSIQDLIFDASFLTIIRYLFILSVVPGIQTTKQLMLINPQIDSPSLLNISD